MKALLLSFTFCFFHVSFAHDGAKTGIFKSIQARPLHKPEAQNNPMIVPVPVYAPVQQYPPVQQIPMQQYPVQQYPPIQQIPMQQYPLQQFVPVQQIPIHYPQYQHYPQMHYPHFQHHSHQHPQFHHGVPC